MVWSLAGALVMMGGWQRVSGMGERGRGGAVEPAALAPTLAYDDAVMSGAKPLAAAVPSGVATMMMALRAARPCAT